MVIPGTADLNSTLEFLGAERLMCQRACWPNEPMLQFYPVCLFLMTLNLYLKADIRSAPSIILRDTTVNSLKELTEVSWKKKKKFKLLTGGKVPPTPYDMMDVNHNIVI